MSSVFEKLNNINVNDHTEGRNGLTYLSWAWAWAELLKNYPDADSKVYETPDGRIYFDDGKTAWVKCSVTIEGKERIEYLPIMDFKNKSIPLEDITSFDVNKSVQRCLTKAISRHGLGLYIYAGEDLPEVEKKPKLVTEQMVNTLVNTCKAKEVDVCMVLSRFSKASFEEFTVEDFTKAMQALGKTK